MSLKKSPNQEILEGEIIMIDNFPLDWLEHQISDRKFDAKNEMHNFPGQAELLTQNERAYLHRLLEEKSGLKIKLETFHPRFRRAAPGTECKTFIHGDQGHFAGVLYLSDLPSGIEAEDFGTVFYRHKKTGWDRIPKMARLGQIAWKFVVDETRDFDAWEVIRKIPFKKNRFVLYNGHLFHSPPHVYLYPHDGPERMTLDIFGELID
jgi:hypothetical protein